MSVLFMMPNWTAPSEVWMQRMMEELGSELGTVVAWDTGGASSWRGRVRAVSLLEATRSAGRLSSVLHLLSHFSANLLYGTVTPDRILLREIGSPGISHILCHYGEFAAQFMCVWASTSVPLYVHFHGYDATFDLRLDDQPDVPYYTDRYQRDIYQLASRATFIANSVFTKSLLVEAGMPRDRIKVKHLGVGIPSAGKVHRSQEEVQILHLGRLVDFKSPDRTIQAFELARARGLKGRLTLAGDGPLRTTCELLRKKSPYQDSIRILGAVTAEQAQKLLQSTDIFTQHNIRGEASRQSECFGVSIVEAMAHGLPVVGTRHGGVVETVVDQETGILLEPGDTERQAEIFLELARNPSLRQRLGDAGRQRVVQHFSMKVEGRRLRAIMGLADRTTEVSG